MHRRAMRLQKEAATSGAVHLPPGAAIGMAVGTEVATWQLPEIAAALVGTELLRHVDAVLASSRRGDQRWRGARHLRTEIGRLLTGSARGFVGETRKRCGLVGALTRWLDVLG